MYNPPFFRTNRHRNSQKQKTERSFFEQTVTEILKNSKQNGRFFELSKGYLMHVGLKKTQTKLGFV